MARTPLSRERILTAALTLADAGGIEALSMRKVGDALGVKAMSLYNHVANKEDIVVGMVDLVVSEVELPSLDTPWKEALRARARALHAVLLQHPWAVLRLMSGTVPTPAWMALVDRTIGILRGAGFDLETVDHAWHTIDSHIYGYTLQVINFPFEREAVTDAAAGFLAQFPRDELPHLYAMTHHVVTTPYNELHELEFGLDLILDSLDRLPRTG